MKALIFNLVTVFAAINVLAQPVTGDWYGTLEVQKTKLHIVFHITKNGSSYSATMDSPDQGAAGIKMDTAVVDGNNIEISVKAAGMKYTSVYDPSNEKCEGTFHQGSVEIPLTLTRTAEQTKVVPRPQDPVDFPYSQEEVTISNTHDSVTLAGTLTLPKDKKASKIVILITGSGPQNRNEEIKSIDHRPFLVWSDWMTRHGIAVLRYDDRGIGKSTGNFSKATSADFANDVSAAVDFIKSRNDLKGMSVGLVGHSEGGMIAPVVASRDSRVKFIVLLAGPGVPLDELLITQSAYGLAAGGAPKDIADLNLETMKTVYAYMKKHAAEPTEKIQPEVKKILVDQLAKYPPEALAGTTADAAADKQLKSDMGIWFRYFVSFEPATYLTKVKCPVLAVNGSLDKQVDADANLAAIDAALKKAKNKDYDIVHLEGLNHLFQKAKTGDPSEYSTITETVNPVALNKVTEWINKH